MLNIEVDKLEKYLISTLETYSSDKNSKPFFPFEINRGQRKIVVYKIFNIPHDDNSALQKSKEEITLFNNVLEKCTDKGTLYLCFLFFNELDRMVIAALDKNGMAIHLHIEDSNFVGVSKSKEETKRYIREFFEKSRGKKWKCTFHFERSPQNENNDGTFEWCISKIQELINNESSKRVETIDSESNTGWKELTIAALTVLGLGLFLIGTGMIPGLAFLAGSSVWAAVGVGLLGIALTSKVYEWCYASESTEGREIENQIQKDDVRNSGNNKINKSTRIIRIALGGASEEAKTEDQIQEEYLWKLQNDHKKECERWRPIMEAQKAAALKKEQEENELAEEKRMQEEEQKQKKQEEEDNLPLNKLTCTLRELRVSIISGMSQLEKTKGIGAQHLNGPLEWNSEQSIESYSTHWWDIFYKNFHNRADDYGTNIKALITTVDTNIKKYNKTVEKILKFNAEPDGQDYFSGRNHKGRV